MEKSDNHKMIESAVERHGYTVREWRDDPDDGLIGVVGRFRVIEEDENNGLYNGDEGELLASIVGAAQYGNQRVAFALLLDEYDTSNDVPDLSVIDPVDS